MEDFLSFTSESAPVPSQSQSSQPFDSLLDDFAPVPVSAPLSSLSEPQSSLLSLDIPSVQNNDQSVSFSVPSQEQDDPFGLDGPPPASLPLSSGLSIYVTKEEMSSKSFDRSNSLHVPDDEEKVAENYSLESIMHTISTESENIYEDMFSFIKNIKLMKLKQEKLISGTLKTLQLTENHLHSLQQENQSNQEEIHLLQNAKQELQDRVGELENSLDQFSQRYEQLQEEFQGVQLNNSELGNRLKDIENLLNDVTMERDQLKAMIETLSETVGEEKSKEIQMEISLQDKDREIVRLNVEIESRQTEKELLEQNLRDKDSSIISLENELSGLREELRVQQESRDSFAALLEEKSSQYENQQQENVKLLNELSDKTDQLLRIQTSFEESESQLTNLRLDFETVRAKLDSALTSNQQLHLEIETKSTTVASLEANVQVLETNLESLRREFDAREESWRNENDDLKQQVVDLGTNLADLRDKYQADESLIQDKGAEVSSLIEKIEFLEKTLENTKNEHQNNVTSLQNNHSQQILELTEQKEKLLTQLKALESGNSEEKNQTSQQVTQLTQDNTKLKNLITEYQNRMKLGSEELKRLKNELSHSEETIKASDQKHQEEILRIQQEKKDMKDLYDALQEKYNLMVTSSSLHSDNTVLMSNMETLLATNINLEAKVAELRGEINKKKAENNEMTQLIAQKTNEMENLTSRNNDLKGSVEKLKKEVQTVASEGDLLTRELINTKLELAMAAGEVDVEHNQVSKLKRVLSTAGTQQSQSPGHTAATTTEHDAGSFFSNPSIKIDPQSFKKKLVNPAVALNKWKKFGGDNDDVSGKRKESGF